MFPPKKKQPMNPGFPPKKAGLDVMVAVGKPKPGDDDLSSPDPVEGMPPKHMAPKPPDAQHEADESPEQEGQEEYGAKLLQDIMTPLTDAGMAPDDARSTLAQIFSALAKCLSEEGSEEGSSQESDETGQY